MSEATRAIGRSIKRAAESGVLKLADLLQEDTLACIAVDVLAGLETMTPGSLMKEPIESFIMYADAAAQLGHRGAPSLHRALRERWPEICSEVAEAAAAHVERVRARRALSILRGER